MSSPVRPGESADVPSWLGLALQVEDLFGPMPDIAAGIERGINRGTALVTGSAGNITGGMLLSRDDRPHRINWLAIAPRARGRGLGGALVQAALDRWSTGDIEVVTFAAGTPGGAAARRLYTRLWLRLRGALLNPRKTVACATGTSCAGSGRSRSLV